MELQVAPYVDQLLQLFLMTIRDQDDEVISNSVFALGVLAESGKESVVKYPLSDARRYLIHVLFPSLPRNQYAHSHKNHYTFLILFCFPFISVFICVMFCDNVTRHRHKLKPANLFHF